MPAHDSIKAQKRLQNALIGLAKDTRFAEFMAEVRAMREAAVSNLCDGNVIVNDRATLACIGEIASYESILSLYQEALNRAAEEAAV
jgi:hypothetical protein